MNASFWRGKRVLVTGHTGFKGSWLTLVLDGMGAKVTGLALPPPTDPSLFAIANVSARCDSLIGDVRDLDAVTRAVASCQPEIVIHMAAQSLVRLSYDAPLETLSTNVLGTANVLEACRSVTVPKVVVSVTSDKCYENREWEWGYREDEPMGGRDPYSASKGCAELVTSAYRRSFLANVGCHVVSARAGNVFGGGDWARDRLIPDLLVAFMRSEVAAVRNPRAIRPWQHVMEPLHGYLTLAERFWQSQDDLPSSWNFGPGPESERSVADIANRLAGLWGSGASWSDGCGDRAFHEAMFLKLDSSRARTRLGWVPCWTLERALEATVEWYQRYARDEDMTKVTEGQIAEYLSCRSSMLASVGEEKGQ